MRKILLILIITFSFLYTEPYKPYPIIFVHGSSITFKNGYSIKIFPLNFNS